MLLRLPMCESSSEPARRHVDVHVHSKERSSSQANTSIAISSNDSATWYGKSRLISKMTLTPYENIGH